MSKCACGSDIWCLKTGECKRCYQQRYYQEYKAGVRYTPKMHSRSCAECGAGFMTRKPSQACCSRRCAARAASRQRWSDPINHALQSQVSASRAAEREGARRKAGLRGCGCGCVVPWYEGRYLQKCDDCVGLVCKEDGCANPVPRHLRYCPTCAESRRKAQRAATRDSSKLVCCEIDCDRPVRARSVCNMHYKRLLRAEGRLVSPAWDDRRRNNYHARRARLAGGRNGDAVMLAELLARDGYKCGICGESVDADAAYPDPLSKSIDHIVPLSRGGAHSPENCQLAHLRCNVSKGAKLAA